MYRVLEYIDRKLNFTRAKAHCDVPCGIYDPSAALIDALTVVRMVDLIKEHLEKSAVQDAEFYNRLTRLITAKEDHAEKVKHEIRVIWGDFIKHEHVEKFPEIHPLVHEIMQLGSKDKQGVDRENAVKLVERVNRFAEIFWEIKGVKTKRVKAPYAPNLEVVHPGL